jgi:DNA-binding NarL/FixJ family response regulator
LARGLDRDQQEIVRQFAGYALSLAPRAKDDLRSEILLSLCEAVAAFRPGRMPLKRYIRYRVRKRIHDWLRKEEGGRVVQRDEPTTETPVPLSHLLPERLLPLAELLAEGYSESACAVKLGITEHAVRKQKDEMRVYLAR